MSAHDPPRPNRPGTFLDQPRKGEWGSDHKAARGYYGIAHGHSDRYFLYAIEWAGSAAGSGIIGNIAYSAIWPLLKKMKRKDKKPVVDGEYPYDENFGEYVDLVAKLAIAERCGELDIRAPDLNEMHIVSKSNVSGSTWYLQVQASNLQAEVAVAARYDVFMQSIPVAIRVIE
jgi:hypothetical protein